MTQYDNNMRGVLFKADKEGNEKRPDYSGNCEINGVKYRIASWIRKSKNGNPFMSLSFQSADEKRSAPQAAEDQEFDQDIPF